MPGCFTLAVFESEQKSLSMHGIFSLRPPPPDLGKETIRAGGPTVASSALMSPLPTELRLHWHPNH